MYQSSFHGADSLVPRRLAEACSHLIDLIIVVDPQVDIEDSHRALGRGDIGLQDGVRLSGDTLEGEEEIIGTRDVQFQDLGRHGEAVQGHTRRDRLLEPLRLVEEGVMGVVIRLRGVGGGDGEALAIAVTVAIVIGAVVEAGKGVEEIGGSHLKRFGWDWMIGNSGVF